MITRILLVIRHAWMLWRVLSMTKNRRKGGWRHLEPYELLKYAETELAELKAAVWGWERLQTRTAARRVTHEAADVSAYAAMIADVCRPNGGKQP